MEKKLTDVAENVLKRPFIDDCGDLGWSQRAVEAEEVCGETSNMRSGHGSSRGQIGLPIIPSGDDLRAGSEDINWGTKIGEDAYFIIVSRRGDSDRLLNASGRAVARVLAVVPCGYDDRDTAVVKLRI